MFYMRVCSSVGLERMATNYKVGGSNPSRLSVFNVKILGKEGFEPSVAIATTVFKTDAIDLSAIFPYIHIYTYNSIIIDIMLKYYCISLFIFLA